MRVGIFGGSFSPVHKGHMKLAGHAYRELNLDRLFFVPSAHSPLKAKEHLLPDSLRLDLLRAALKNDPHFSVSGCEIQRGGRSFTVDTLRFFRKKFKNRATLFFLAGADVLKSFSRWKSPDKVLELCRFVVMTRPGHRLPSGSKTRSMLFLPMDALDVSASEIRKRLEKKADVRTLVPSGTAKILRDYYKKIDESSRG